MESLPTCRQAGAAETDKAAVLVDRLRFAYPPLTPGAVAPWIMDGLNLEVATGEWLAIMGPSDAGKTTLCHLLAGLAPHLTSGTKEGRTTVCGRDTDDHPPPALADVVGVLFQEADAQLFNSTVEAEIAWGLENLGLPAPEIQLRVDEILAEFGLESLRDRVPDSLSGGEKKRVALVAVLAMQPQLLILDEPMGGLDPLSRSQVLSALARLRRDRSTTIIMTESDPEAVAAFADRLVVLHQGKKALSGTPRELFHQAEQMAALGIRIPVMAQLAASLNQRLGTTWDFLTVEEARQSLAVDLG